MYGVQEKQWEMCRGPISVSERYGFTLKCFMNIVEQLLFCKTRGMMCAESQDWPLFCRCRSPVLSRRPTTTWSRRPCGTRRAVRCSSECSCVRPRCPSAGPRSASTSATRRSSRLSVDWCASTPTTPTSGRVSPPSCRTTWPSDTGPEVRRGVCGVCA